MLYIYWIFSLLYIYWIQNLATYSNNTFIFFIIFGYIIIFVWLIIFFSIFYTKRLKNNPIKRENMYTNLYIFLWFFSYLFLFQNFKTIFIYNSWIYIYILLYIYFLIILMSTVYIIYKKIWNNKSINKNILIWWWIIIFYFFILGRPVTPYIPDNLYLTKNSHDYLIINKSLEKKWLFNKKNILIDSYPNNRLNIPFIINFSTLYNYEKIKLSYNYNNNFSPIVIMPIFWKEIFTIFYIKNLINNNYILKK